MNVLWIKDGNIGHEKQVRVLLDQLLKNKQLNIIERTKIQLIIWRDNALIATVCDVAFTKEAIIENDKEEIIINNLALLSFVIPIFISLI